MKKIGNELKRTPSSLLEAFGDFNELAKLHGRKVYGWLVTMLFTLASMVIIGYYTNLYGYLWVNILFAIAIFFIAILTFTHPNLLILVFNVDIIMQLAPDVVDMENNFIQLFLRIFRRIAALFMVFFLFLGIFPIKESPKAFVIGALILIAITLLTLEGEK